MPRDPLPPRLWYRKPRKAKGGRTAEKGVYVILDGGRQHSTGCGKADREGAERALAQFVTAKHQVPRRRREIDAIPLADVLNIYLQYHVPTLNTAAKATGRIERLLNWWGAMTLDEVTGASCRRFTAERTVELPGVNCRICKPLSIFITARGFIGSPCWSLSPPRANPESAG